MFNIIRTTALSALIAIGAMAVQPVAAHADNVYLGFGGQHRGAQFGIQVGDDNWRRDDWRRPGNRYHACTPARAVDKAWRLGVRNPRVVDVNRRTIEVRGHKRGHRVELLFARAPHCPIVR